MLAGWAEPIIKRRNSNGSKSKHEKGRRDNGGGGGGGGCIIVFPPLPLFSISHGGIPQMFRLGFYI